MRRPLCLIGLVYVAAVIIGMAATVRGAPVCDQLNRQQITVAGYVDWKEYRISEDEEVLVITLKDAVVLKEDQTANLKQILSGLSGENSNFEEEFHTAKFDRAGNSDSKKIIEQFWKEIQREDARELQGVLCYMKQNMSAYAEGNDLAVSEKSAYAEGNDLAEPEKSADTEHDDLSEQEWNGVPRMGSLVIMQGTFYAFSHATNPGEFDSAEYYRISNQQGRMMQTVCLAQSDTYDRFRERLCQIREYLSLCLDACYDVSDASVMKAMLLGEKGTLDPEIKSLYQQNGIIHILAISGLHLSVIGMGLYKILAKIRLPAVVNITLSIGLMYCYGTMTGMGTSMTRAYIMFVLHLCAKLVGRTYDLYTALMIAALSVLVQQPLYLLHSGFLFSFGAVCGIGLFLPAVERNLLTGSRVEKLLMSGAAVSIFTLPVYLRFYYEFPPYSVLLNLIVIPCMTLVLVCGLVCMGLAACFLPLGMLASCPGHVFLWFYEKCCQWCMNLPGHSWITGCPGVWQVALFLGILAGVVLWEQKMPKMLFWQGVLCALLVFTVRLPSGLEITMIDVGQGDCIYLSEAGGARLLIDGGSSSQSDVADYQILPFLKYKGVNRLDAVFVTHPDSDHENGIRAWLEEYGEKGVEIGTLVLPDVDEESKNEEYRELEQLAAAAEVPVYYLSVGEVIQQGEVMLTCLHPPGGWYSEDTNAYSIVLYLTYGDFAALFTGDLEGAGEQMVLDLLEDGEQAGVTARPLTLLKVAHHGSRNSTPREFLEAVSPRIALISAGENNSYGHPHQETLERLEECGAETFITCESGAVTVRTDGKSVNIAAFLGVNFQ